LLRGRGLTVAVLIGWLGRILVWHSWDWRRLLTFLEPVRTDVVGDIFVVFPR